MKLGRRGQIWSEFMMGIMILGVIGIMYTLLYQVYTYSLRPSMITYGVNSQNLAVLDLAWWTVPIPVLLVVLFSWLNTARGRMRYGY